MATGSAVSSSRRAERWFFGGMAALIAITVFVGFAPTFYLAKWLPPPHPMQPMTPLVYLHGGLFTGWILLLIAQAALIARGRTDLHRKLGVVGACLAALMVPVGVTTALHGALRASGRPDIEPLRFLAIPLFDLLVFSALVVAGIRARRDPGTHKRLMLLATIAIMLAAVGRLPLAIARSGMPGVFAVADLFLLPLVAFDLAMLGRVHRATLWGGLLILVSQPLRMAILGTAAWMAFAKWAVSLVS